MITKGITFEQVYDLYAVRIIFNPDAGSTDSERDQCYHVFSIITGIYKYKSDRIRDWVKHPKNNGYEALHCTLMSHSGIWIEVQIRTTRMNDIAERGIAAHWTYKKDGFVDENENEMDSWISKVKEILVNPDVNALELLDIIHNDLTTTDIFVFTPKGEQKRIPKGATALDFAYSIHSEIGNKAIAAKVNMKLEPLSYVLKTGDQVEIITAETEKPKREWLQFLKTRKAKNIVMDYLKGERQESINVGRKMVEEQLNAIGVKLNDSTVKALLNGYEIFEDDMDELYFRVGIGMLKLNNLEEIVKKSEEKQEKAPSPATSETASTQPDQGEKKAVTEEGSSSVHNSSQFSEQGQSGVVTVETSSEAHKSNVDDVAAFLMNGAEKEVEVDGWNDFIVCFQSFLVASLGCKRVR